MRTSTLVPVVAGLIAVAAVAIAAGPTYSALTAGADLVVGAGGTGDGPAAGSSGPIDLVTIDDRDIATPSNGSAAFVPLAPDDRYEPGRTFRLGVGVADNDPDVAAAITVAVVPVDSAGTGQVGASPNATPQLLVTVVDTTTGEVLIGSSATDARRGAPVAEASGMIGHLAARDADPLDDGDRWSRGAAQSRHDLEVLVYRPDGPAAREPTGARSDVALMLYGIGQP
ncbi:hypothetical protein KNO15_21865 [Leifsonia shinshuensis]|uniref:hypothetical protein n=1 Tax=Leifsonia shinshuensis TaxID=150026 RepID=UPI001F509AD1|nr:hypothetical protein [Leifsonia shinshuensis]MCI0159357.1 hypothetical protein [Leifsonia shinshuensis]